MNAMEESAKKRQFPLLHGKCIASECMMWRWFDYFTVNGDVVRTERGSCGLAGKPLE